MAAGGTDKIYKIADDILNGTAEYSIPKEWLDHNLVKADAFNNRVVNGMNLSDRVWNITDSFYEDLRMAVDEGMKSGKSAQSLSREVRQLLKEPGNLYRRVRNRYGKLVPSKRMRRKKTGKGVYKSSYKNALRLAGTETNIAYRTADHERWNALPFVEGIEISVSHTNHTVPDICDELAGVYPKSFKFVGWHPHCRCYAVAKLPSVEDYEKYREAMANGTDDEFEFDEVTELPDNFKEWYANNEDKINSAKNVPYFIQDNFKGKKEDGKIRGIQMEEPLPNRNFKQNKEFYSKQIKLWADENLKEVQIDKHTTAKRLIIQADEVDVIVSREFLKETFNKHLKSDELDAVMNVAMNVKEWLPNAKHVATEPGRHHDFPFEIFTTVYNGRKVKAEVKVTEGNILYVVKIDEKDTYPYK